MKSALILRVSETGQRKEGNFNCSYNTLLFCIYFCSTSLVMRWGVLISTVEFLIVHDLIMHMAEGNLIWTPWIPKWTWPRQNHIS